MSLPWLRSALPVGAALCTLFVLSAPALAEGEACLRDTDCGGSEACLGGVCAAPETAPATCEAGCEFDETCDDGFCKVEGVTCDNPAGRCWVEQNHGACDCEDGNGSGWTDGFNPDDPQQTKTDEELLTQCGEALVDACGTEAPSLPSSCVGDVLTDCEAFLELENIAIGDCGEGTPEVNIFRVGQCCDSFGEQAYVEYRECVLAADALSCELLVECEDGGFGGTQNEGGETDDGTDPTDAGTAATAGDTDAAPGADDEDKSSCAVERGNRGWTLLGLFALLPFARRRRTASCG